jgi:class 3 adenylate cyclase
MQPPETHYAVRPDGVSIAYQVFGDGPADLLVSPGLASHLDLAWTDPDLARLWRRLASVARVIVYDSLGDGTLAVFDGPARAIHAAEAIREEVRQLGIEIRAGVHTGECELIGEDLGGLAVHIGARVGAVRARSSYRARSPTS